MIKSSPRIEACINKRFNQIWNPENDYVLFVIRTRKQNPRINIASLFAKSHKTGLVASQHELFLNAHSVSEVRIRHNVEVYGAYNFMEWNEYYLGRSIIDTPPDTLQLTEITLRVIKLLELILIKRAVSKSRYYHARNKSRPASS